MKCWNCGEVGHFSAQCKAPRKNKVHYVAADTEETEESMRVLLAQLANGRLAEARAELDRYKRGLVPTDCPLVADPAVVTLFGPSQQ